MILLPWIYVHVHSGEWCSVRRERLIRCVVVKYLHIFVQHCIQPTIFKQAVELGATTTSAFTDRVTHLVAVDHGGAKYQAST